MNALMREALHNFSKIMTSSDLENDTPVLDPLRIKDKNVTPAFGPDVFDVTFKNVKVKPLQAANAVSFSVILFEISSHGYA